MSRLPNNDSADEADAKTQIMAPSLSQSYPLAAFNEESANYVLIDLEWFREADIRQRLNRWRQQHLPESDALPEAAATAPVDIDGRNWIARWLRVEPTDRGAAATLTLVRRYHPAAFAHLLKTDIRAAEMAVRLGWASDSSDRAAEWSDPETVRRAIRSCYGSYNDGTQAHPTPQQIIAALRTLRGLITKFAPHNLSLIPEGAEGETDEYRNWDSKTAGDLRGETRLLG
jgi:hypothetical protein